RSRTRGKRCRNWETRSGVSTGAVPAAAGAGSARASSPCAADDAAGDRLLRRRPVQVVEIVEQPAAVVRRGLVVGGKHDRLGGTAFRAGAAVTALVHLDIEAGEHGVRPLAFRFDVDAAVGADPLALETDDAAVLAGLRIDGQREQPVKPMRDVETLERVLD